MGWIYKNTEVTMIPEEIVGFVYLITNTTNGRMYIGKKLARFKRSRPPLKGRKNKRRYKVDSDWQDYYGSSDDLTRCQHLVKTNSRGRYFSTASPKRNYRMWKHVNSSHARSWKPMITTMVTSVSGCMVRESSSRKKTPDYC